jgi:hypothetical protein
MEKFFNTLAKQKLKGVRAWAAPGDQSRSTTHGGFDDDDTTMASVIALIKGKNI